MKSKLQKKIKNALVKGDIDTLKSIDKKDLLAFHKDGLKILMYAAAYANETILLWLIDAAVTHINKTYQKDEEARSDAFDDFFYVYYDVDDNFDISAATLAEQRNFVKAVAKLDEVAGLKPGHLLKVSDIKTTDIPKAVARAAHQRPIKQQGVESDAGVISRAPRKMTDFAGEREMQLLKHFSTMLFAHMPKKATRIGAVNKYRKQAQIVEKLEEVEAMHVRYEDKSIIVVSGNMAHVTSQFSNTFPTITAIQTKISTNPQGQSGEAKVRYNRYSRYFQDYFKQKVTYPFDVKSTLEIKGDLASYKHLLELLQDKNGSVQHHLLEYDKHGTSGLKIAAESQDYMHSLLDAESGAIIFLDTSRLPVLLHSRHAEEFLCDVAECMAAYAKAKKKKFHVAISGKKRPCLSCYSRMESSAAVGVHGGHPGYLWTGRLQEQKRFTPEAADNTGKNLGEVTNVTVNANGDEDPGFGSGTEESPKHGS